MGLSKPLARQVNHGTVSLDPFNSPLRKRRMLSTLTPFVCELLMFLGFKFVWNRFCFVCLYFVFLSLLLTLSIQFLLSFCHHRHLFRCLGWIQHLQLCRARYAGLAVALMTNFFVDSRGAHTFTVVRFLCTGSTCHICSYFHATTTIAGGASHIGCTGTQLALAKLFVAK